MKIPITDQFLWDIFMAASKTEDYLWFLLHPPRTMREVFYDTKSPLYRKYRRVLNPQEFSRLLYHLKRHNYIKAKGLENKKAIVLTRDGLSKVLKASFKIEHKNKRKDGKWIMIAFDIPQKHTRARNLLRSILLNLGYKMFQQSVWVTPYDVSDKTERLLQAHSLESYVKIFLIEKL